MPKQARDLRTMRNSGILRLAYLECGYDWREDMVGTDRMMPESIYGAFDKAVLY